MVELNFSEIAANALAQGYITQDKYDDLVKSGQIEPQSPTMPIPSTAPSFIPFSQQQEQRNQWLKHATTGEIRAVSQREYAKVAPIWKGPAPTFDEMQLAGVEYGKKEQGWVTEDVGYQIGDKIVTAEDVASGKEPTYQKAIAEMQRKDEEEAKRPQGYFEIAPDGVRTWIDPSAIELGIKPTYEEASEKAKKAEADYQVQLASVQAETAKSEAEYAEWEKANNKFKPFTNEKGEIDVVEAYRHESITKKDWQTVFGKDTQQVIAGVRDSLKTQYQYDKAFAVMQKAGAVNADGSVSPVIAVQNGVTPRQWADLFKDDKQALGAYSEAVKALKNTVADPKDGQLYDKNWYTPYVNAGIFKTPEDARLTFSKHGMRGVQAYADAQQAGLTESAYGGGVSKKTVKTILNTPYTKLQTGFDGLTSEQKATTVSLAMTRAMTDVPADKMRDNLVSMGFDAKAADAIVRSRSTQLDQKTLDEISPSVSNAMQKMPESERNRILDEYRYGLVGKQTQPLLHTAVSMIPVVGTVMSVRERGFKSGWTIASFAVDAILVAELAKAATAGARQYTLVGETGRLKAGAKGFAQSLVPRGKLSEVMVASVKDPILQTTDRMRWGYIPLASLEHGYHTSKIPIRIVGSPEDAMKVRDLLMEKFIAGEKPVIEYKGTTYKLNTPFIKESFSGGPDIAWTMKPGATVEPEGLYSGVGLHTRFVKSTSGGRVPEGGKPGALMLSRTQAQKTISSAKTYSGTAEAERVTRGGTTFSGVKPIGYSRTAEGQQFTIASEGSIPIMQRLAAKLGEPVLEGRSLLKPAVEVTKDGKKVKIKPINLVEEANLWDKAASEAEKAGDYAKAKRYREEAQSYRREVLTRPMTSPTARALAQHFYVAAVQAYDEAVKLRSSSRPESRKLSSDYASLSDVIRQSADYLRELSRNRVLLQKYNRVIADTNPRLRVERTGRGTARLIAISRLPQSGRGEGSRTEMTSVTGRVPARVPGRTPPRSPIPSRMPPRIPTTSIVRTPELPRVPGRRVPGTKPPRVPSVPRIPSVPRVPGKGMPPKPPSKGKPETKSRKESGKGRMPKGTVAWKQGFIWIIIKPPYDKTEVVTDPPKGATVVDGPRSAYETIQELGGKVPKDFQVDVGVFDVAITGGERRGKRLRFIKPKRETTSPLTIKRVRNS